MSYSESVPASCLTMRPLDSVMAMEQLTPRSRMLAVRWEPLLALALAEAGKPSEACALLSHWGTPPPPDDWSGALFWPRPLLVRAACLEKTDAARAQQLRGLVAALQPR